MRYVPSALIQYRYPILAMLSLLLISEMVLAGIGPVPIEYEWVLGWLLFLTVLAWAGIAGVIGVGAPVGGDIMKHGGRILIVLSLALFAIFLAPFLFLSQYIVGLLGWLYGFLLIVVWTGIVVIVGAISNLEHGMKTYLLIGVFPLLMLLQFEVFWTELLSINLLMLIGDLLSSVLGISRDSTGILSWMLALLFIVLSNSLVLASSYKRNNGQSTYRSCPSSRLWNLGGRICCCHRCCATYYGSFYHRSSACGSPEFCFGDCADWEDTPSYSEHYGSRGRYAGNDSSSYIVLVFCWHLDCLGVRQMRTIERR